MAYDEARGEIILHGGYYFTNKNDTWRWNGSTWSLASTTGPARYVFGMTYDSARQRVILHGGTTCCGEVEYPQTYTWNGSAWTLCPVQGPARGYMNIAFDRARDVVVLPGGMGPTPSGRAYVPETWELAMSVLPATRRVPTNYPTIQAAVDAAVAGDTVLVAPGEYVESVNLRGKPILVKSEQTGAAAVLAPNNTRAFVASTGESAQTRVLGFVIGRGGKWGGGVGITNASPVFDSCDFISCRNNTGGGALVQGGSPAFIACDFRDCFVNGVGSGLYGGGGAIRSVGGSVTVDGCSFVDCHGWQGEIMMQEGGGSSTLKRSVFLGADVGSSVGYIYNVSSNLTIEDCMFDSMDATALFGWSPYTVRRCTFRNMTGYSVMNGRYGQWQVEDCSFEQCSTTGFIFAVTYSTTFALRDCTFCQCSTPTFEGGWSDLGGNDFDAICSCFGDLNADGTVDGYDFAVVLTGWQFGPGSNEGDLSGDGETDAVDLALMLANWGPCR
jgi:hypothetical protein